MDRVHDGGSADDAQATIAFSDLDAESARKYLRALDEVGVKVSNLDARVGADVDGGTEVSI